MEYDESTKFFTSLDEDQDLWLLFTHTRYAVFRARERELQRYGISPEQASLLFLVKVLKFQATEADLARYLLRKPHSVSALINRMVKKGLIKKAKNLSTRNLVRVVFTPKGKLAYEQSTKRGPIHRTMGTLSEEEKKEFRKYLGKIYSRARKEIGLDIDNLPPSE